MELLLLSLGACIAGLVDAVVGGGGLIQLPLLLAVFPETAIPVLFGTNKLSSIAGTGSAIWRYSRHITLPRIAIPTSIAALVGAWLGAGAVSLLPSTVLKPLVIFVLTVLGIYTFCASGFGTKSGTPMFNRSGGYIAALVGFGLGFYDGFFGPGTGSFLIFAFVRLFGMDMLHASASAKLVNLATNLAALSFFFLHMGVLWRVGLVMAFANICGAQIGSLMALKHGNRFVRWLLLVVVTVLIAKLSSDLYFQR
ncbi:MAG TPA: TSUP family transporter [Rhodocyclaceae bacterium]|nr:TSUP family transporter [Rhodocyclaceae bacterium]